MYHKQNTLIDIIYLDLLDIDFILDCLHQWEKAHITDVGIDGDTNDYSV